MLLSGSCLFHHSLYCSISLYFDPSFVLISRLRGFYEDRLVYMNQSYKFMKPIPFFFFIKKGALLFYTFCTRYCITISFFIEFLTSLNIKAPPNWNPVSMCFWRYSWCNYFCKKSCMINHLNGIQIRRYMFIPFKMEC